MSAFATEGLAADLVLLIDVDGPVAADRRSSHLDRIELAGDEFHARVVAAYRAMAAAEPDRWVVVDGTGTVEEGAERIAAGVADRLGPA